MSKRVSLRIPDDLHQTLTEQAEREHRTISNLIVALLRETQRIGQVSVAPGVAKPDQEAPETAS